MSITDKMFRRKVQDKYPDIALKIIEKPVLSDVGYVCELYDIFSLIVKRQTESFEVNDFRTLFIAVMLKMYDPDYFNGYRKKVKDGLRPAVAELFDVDLNYVSVLFTNAVDRVRIYKEIAESVDKIYEKMKIYLGEGRI